ncbi:deoxynucleotidyltransferase terminal-interacting protein 2 [Xenopus laevis]|uniref:Deoxynucleotidyltransferase terminal-interacting protein 2 n=2 Tax=Xenopus laevis TaxID=8355 RepID=A0A1L8FIS5_XENLA|nr:deoxynucleotidyltransferase terminal-interacting protein 2 [Xenopus laevis]OCT71483.1 hypothetical protein XELAEV_18034459mg [Xenopus laevis]
MVATRRGTRVGPEEIKETGADMGGQAENAADVDASTTPADTQSQAIKGPPSEEQSGIINEDSDVSKAPKSTSQTVTRSRRRSGQSDGEVSEADSTSSSHSLRMTRSRQSLTRPTDSSRTLRLRRSVVVTDPILELKEDAELSEAESNCSSVSARDTRRRSTRAKTSGSQMSVLASGTVSEVIEISDSESNCSSASGVISRRTRSAKIQAKLVKCPPPPPSKIEEVSDAESCSSGISENPVARRVRQRTRSTTQQGDKGLSPETATKNSLKPETPKKPIPERIASEGEQNLFSPRRSLRTRHISEQEHVNTSKDMNRSASSTKREVLSTPIKDSQEPLDLPKINQHSANLSNEVIDLEQMPAETSITNMDSKNRSYESIDLEQDPEEPSQISKEAEDRSVEIIDLEEEESAEPSKETANISKEPIDLEQEALDSSNNSKELSSPVVSDPVDIHSQILEGTSHKLDGKSSSKGFGSNDNLSSHPNISLYLDSDESEGSQHSDDAEESTDDEEMEEEAENAIGSRKSKEQPSADALGDGLFVIDTVPGLDPIKTYYVDHKKDTAKSINEESEEEEESDEDFIDEDEEEEEDDENDLLNRPNPALKLSSSIKTGLNIKDLGGLCISFDGEKPNPGPSLLKKMKKDHSKLDEIMKKSVITPDIEKKESIKPYKESINKLKQQRKEEREKTTGLGWFDMKAPEMTEELKNDLKALKMRAAMNPKRFYKKNDRDGFPKYFQVGTVVDSPLDFYHSRIPKKERKRTLVDELLADSEFRRYNKKKYREIMAEKAAMAEGKKKRKKKTFRK